MWKKNPKKMCFVSLDKFQFYIIGFRCKKNKMELFTFLFCKVKWATSLFSFALFCLFLISYMYMVFCSKFLLLSKFFTVFLSKIQFFFKVPPLFLISKIFCSKIFFLKVLSCLDGSKVWSRSVKRLQFHSVLIEVTSCVRKCCSVL